MIILTAIIVAICVVVTIIVTLYQLNETGDRDENMRFARDIAILATVISTGLITATTVLTKSYVFTYTITTVWNEYTETKLLGDDANNLVIIRVNGIDTIGKLPSISISTTSAESCTIEFGVDHDWSMLKDKSYVTTISAPCSDSDKVVAHIQQMKREMFPTYFPTPL